MSNDFKRKMRAFDSGQKHTAAQEFAGMRQWYYSLRLKDRRRFKEHIQSLAEISDRIKNDWPMFVKVHCSWTQEEGTIRAPEEIVRAIDQWEETAES